MRGTTETMGTVLRTEFDEETGQFLQRSVEHPFTAAQNVPKDASDLLAMIALVETDAPSIPNETVPTPAMAGAANADPSPIEGLRIVA